MENKQVETSEARPQPAYKLLSMKISKKLNIEYPLPFFSHYQIWIPIPSATWAASISVSLSVGWACTLRAISAGVNSIM